MQSLGRVAICIPTCRRPEWLERLLRSLPAAIGQVQNGLAVVVLVCDNDPAGSAATVVRACADSAPWPVEYVHEPRRGIAHARNALINESMARDSDAVVFLDDDEVPELGWLASLLAARERFAADVVVGPVVPVYEPGVASWIIQGGFFERTLHPSGTLLPTANSGNTLVARRVFERTGKFDPRFGLTGGEDTHFFFRAAFGGARIVWSAEATVYETVPLSRARAAWLVLRAYRGQNAHVMCERDLLPPTRWVFRRVLTAMAHLAIGTLRLAATGVLGRAPATRAAQQIARGAGGLAAIFGVTYREYSSIHGR